MYYVCLRMEMIPVSGYSQEDKIPIASRHLLPRQLQVGEISSDDEREEVGY